MVSGSVIEMELQYQLGDEVTVLRLERDGELTRITIADRVYEVSILHTRSGELTFTVDGITHTAYIASEGTTRYIAIDGDVFELKKPDERRVRRKQQHGEDNLAASMPGQVTKVLVSEGDSVQRGQPLIVLEAMKMEIRIAAPHDGRVVKVLAQPGQIIDRGQELIEMTTDRQL
jgi:3-methylcrotonyl-CoA carboxylase alpha subunit